MPGRLRHFVSPFGPIENLKPQSTLRRSAEDAEKKLFRAKHWVLRIEGSACVFERVRLIFLGAEAGGYQLDEVLYAHAGVQEADELLGSESGAFSGDGQFIDCRD